MVEVLLPPGRGGSVGAFDRPLPDGGALVSEINGRWIDNIGSDAATLPFSHERGAGAYSIPASTS